MIDAEFSDSDDDESKIELLFNKATEHLPHIYSDLSQNDLLYLYAYYKQATVGKCNTPKPRILQIEARSKWQAWKQLEDMTSEQAKQEYISKVKHIDPLWYEITLSEFKNKSKQGWAVHSTLQQNPDEIEVKNDNDKDAFDWVQEGNFSGLLQYMTTHKDKKADLLQKLDTNGMALIHWTTDRNEVIMLKFLLDCGANVNLRDNEQQTALHYAVSCAHIECIEILLKHGADVKICDGLGKNCLDIAEDPAVRLMLEKHLN